MYLERREYTYLIRILRKLLIKRLISFINKTALAKL